MSSRCSDGGGVGRRGGAAALVVATALSWLPARAELLDAVAAVVGSEVVTLSEVEDRLGPALPPRGGTPEDEARRKALLRRALDEVVADRLLQREAQAQGIATTPQEIDAAIADVRRANNIDDAALDGALAQQGLTRQAYREVLRTQLTRMKVVEYRVKPRITLTEDDVKARYARMVAETPAVSEAKVRDIFVPSDKDPAQARRLVYGARQRLRDGVAFEQVARETDGPLAELAGDLGWMGPGMMLPEVERRAFAMQAGQVSEPFEAGGGWHLLLVEEVRGSGGAPPLSQVREELRQQLMGERLQKATDDYVAELRRIAVVEVRLP